jgi:hypothetical protein
MNFVWISFREHIGLGDWKCIDAVKLITHVLCYFTHAVRHIILIKKYFAHPCYATILLLVDTLDLWLVIE